MEEEAPVCVERPEVLAQLRCLGCGYGVVVSIAPESCPICRSSVWEHAGSAGVSRARRPESEHHDLRRSPTYRG